jgi:hypothetical protein
MIGNPVLFLQNKLKKLIRPVLVYKLKWHSTISIYSEKVKHPTVHTYNQTGLTYCKKSRKSVLLFNNKIFITIITKIQPPLLRLIVYNNLNEPTTRSFTFNSICLRYVHKLFTFFIFI